MANRSDTLGVGTTVLSTKGQIVIPQQLRKKLKLKPGIQLVLAVTARNTLEIKKLKDVKTIRIN